LCCYKTRKFIFRGQQKDEDADELLGHWTLALGGVAPPFAAWKCGGILIIKHTFGRFHVHLECLAALLFNVATFRLINYVTKCAFSSFIFGLPSQMAACKDLRA